MKLKALNPRLHNIIFHTHTVAGIVISFALFIIFYAGAFALFRDELFIWENHQSRSVKVEEVSTETILDKVRAHYPDFKESGQTSIVYNSKSQPYIQFYADLNPKDDKAYRRIRALINPETWEITDNENPKTSVGETLYHLHYFDQIPQFGIWISGLVSLFFLFAIVTGVLVHWKNMIRKFYSFSLKKKIKNIWTDAHTMLSIIGLPFQVIYAVTGCLFGLLTLLLAPSVVLMFQGSTDPIYENIQPQRTMQPNEDAKLANMISITDIYNDIQDEFPEHTILNAVTIHYGYEDATVSFNIDDGKGIVNDGNLVYSLVSGERIAEILPNDKTYTQTVYNLMTKLHFATFGGVLLKIIYFILAMITSFSIISGVMIWKTARDKSNYTDKQKRFHHKVTKFYLAICLGLFPATALLFIANKAIPFSIENRAFYENSVFFVGWLILTLIGLFWNNLRQLNIRYLILGGIASLTIPIINGIVTGDWFFIALYNAHYIVGSIDIFWLLTGIAAIRVANLSRTKEIF
ncbi:PepSY-associated TM helix domain-containing protein [Psychroflexus tropicus]|uniref:PepSY-associated TM helix domain-containing protein n=1 Tax=Psychroflexus tropicus TaxID=197345 RepID=UPI0003638CB5|nr:PepSY-associated TM helix domain-containing protein [Psychroflexus tropicus]